MLSSLGGFHGPLLRLLHNSSATCSASIPRAEYQAPDLQALSSAAWWNRRGHDRIEEEVMKLLGNTLPNERDTIQTFEMAITGQDICGVGAGGCVDDSVCGGEPVGTADFSSGNGRLRVQIGHDAHLREGNYLVRLLLPGLSHQPFAEFQLHDGRNEPFLALRKMSYDVGSRA